MLRNELWHELEYNRPPPQGRHRILKTWNRVLKPPINKQYTKPLPIYYPILDHTHVEIHVVENLSLEENTYNIKIQRKKYSFIMEYFIAASLTGNELD